MLHIPSKDVALSDLLLLAAENGKLIPTNITNIKFDFVPANDLI
jgi:hypothetical protein